MYTRGTIFEHGVYTGTVLLELLGYDIIPRERYKRHFQGQSSSAFLNTSGIYGQHCQSHQGTISVLVREMNKICQVQPVSTTRLIV